jgi:hypothetical protein
MRCVCNEELDTIPEQTYICLNQNQYDSIIQQAQGSSACYGSTLSFGGATGLSAFGGMTSGFLQWTFGEGGGVPKLISFYYDDELYYLLGQCPVLCDPAYQIPEDSDLTLVDCREYGVCCQARLATPYCKILSSEECPKDCFLYGSCPTNCEEPSEKPSPFYICENDDDNPTLPTGATFFTKKNGYYYLVTKTQGWIPFGEQLYPTENISEIILGEPCCNEGQEGCSGGTVITTGPQPCCNTIDNPFTKPHPGKANITATISFEASGLPVIGQGGDCSTTTLCCPSPATYNDTMSANNLRSGESKEFDPISAFPTCISGQCPDVTRTLQYSLIGDDDNTENPFIPVFRIESTCSCSPVCTLPDILFDSLDSDYNCEDDFLPNFGNPILIVKRGSIDDIVSKLNETSCNKYRASKLSSQDFWFGWRYKDPLNIASVPGDEIMYEDSDPEYNDTGGVRCVRTYFARSPKYYVRVGTCGSIINNCDDCIYRVSPRFIQSVGLAEPFSNPGCSFLPSSKTLVEWQNNPNAEMLLTFGTDCFSGGLTDVYLCSGFYHPCIVDYWNGTQCTFTAQSE